MLADVRSFRQLGQGLPDPGPAAQLPHPLRIVPPPAQDRCYRCLLGFQGAVGRPSTARRRACRSSRPCLRAVSIRPRMQAKCSAPARVRKPPEAFICCLALRRPSSQCAHGARARSCGHRGLTFNTVAEQFPFKVILLWRFP